MKRPIFFSSFFSIHWSGSKFFTSPAMLAVESRWIELGDPADAALTGQQVAPDFVGADATARRPAQLL